MSTSATTEIDPIIKKAVRLLHSSNPSSATELRLLLEELITQRAPSEKTLTLSKRILDMENSFPGLVVAPPPPAPQEPQVDEVINLTISPDADADAGTEDETNLKDFGDLNCCVCGEMMITATNRLIECSKCSKLYHQECHKPSITDEEASEDREHNWQCDDCSNKPSTSKGAGIVVDEPMPLKSSGASSSPDVAATSQASTSSTSSTSKHHHHHHHHKSSSSSHSSGSSSKRKSHK